MIERGAGCIVNVGSIAAHNGGGPGSGAYSASKAAIVTLTKSLAKELAPHGIRVNCVNPGVIDTPFHEVFSTPEAMKNFVKMIPLGRVGNPMECAKVIVFLLRCRQLHHRGIDRSQWRAIDAVARRAI